MYVYMSKETVDSIINDQNQSLNERLKKRKKKPPNAEVINQESHGKDGFGGLFGPEFPNNQVLSSDEGFKKQKLGQKVPVFESSNISAFEPSKEEPPKKEEEIA